MEHVIGMGRPGDVRFFVHKRIGAAVKGFVTSGLNPVSAAGAFIKTPSRSGGRRTGPCGNPINVRHPDGVCRPRTRGSATDLVVRPFAMLPGGVPGLSLVPHAGVGVTGGGQVVMGRYGAAEVPGSKIVDRAVCRPGMVVGDDGLCYNRSQIKNSQRQWPRGRRPLLTGGEMRAISIASRAASRMTRTAVRLQELGLIKKPIVRKPRKKK